MISSLWENSNIKPIKKHVNGHQDAIHRVLSPLEKLNCQMDSDAKKFAHNFCKSDKDPPYFTPSNIGHGTILCGTKLVTSNIQSSLYKQITHQQMIRWLSNNGEVKSDLVHS